MYSTKYRDLLALLIVLDEAESCAKSLGRTIPRVAHGSQGYLQSGRPLRPSAVTAEDIAAGRLFGPRFGSP